MVPVLPALDPDPGESRHCSTAVDIDTAALQHGNYCTLQPTRQQDHEVITTDNSQMDLSMARAPDLARKTAPDLTMARAPDLAMARAPVPATSSLVAPAQAPWRPSPAYSVQYQTGEVTTTTARPRHSVQVQPSYRYGYSTPDKVRVLTSCRLCRYK